MISSSLFSFYVQQLHEHELKEIGHSDLTSLLYSTKSKWKAVINKQTKRDVSDCSSHLCIQHMSDLIQMPGTALKSSLSDLTIYLVHPHLRCAPGIPPCMQTKYTRNFLHTLNISSLPMLHAVPSSSFIIIIIGPLYSEIIAPQSSSGSAGPGTASA